MHYNFGNVEKEIIVTIVLLAAKLWIVRIDVYHINPTIEEEPQHAQT